MHLRDKVLEFRSERNKEKIVSYFNGHPEKITGLIHLITELEEYPLKEYASWILIHHIQSGKSDLGAYYPGLVDTLFKTKNQTVLRNITCSLSRMPYNSYRESELIDLLIDFIRDSTNKIALQVYSIYLLLGFVKRYPELLPEITGIITHHSKGKTVAYIVAQRKFITKTKNI